MIPACLVEGENYGNLDKKTELDFAWLSLTSYGAEDKYNKHYHENPYLSLLINGAYTETNKASTEIINNGELIFRPVAYNHSNGFCGKPGLCFNIQFKKNWKEHIDFNFSLPQHWQIYKCGTFPLIYKSLYAFLNDNNTHISELILNWLFETNKLNLPESSIPWIHIVKDILENETNIYHTIQSVSERIFVHPVYLAGCFKKKTGLTMGEYQMQARLKKTKHLLFNTKKSITEIALDCGFYDAAHFIKNYKSLYGFSPAKFRKSINT